MNKTLYRISLGKLEKSTIINEHNMNDGAINETYLCRDSNGQKFVCSKDFGFLSEKEAWLEYYVDIGNAVEDTKRQIQDAIERKEYLLSEDLRVKKIIEDLG